MTTTIPCPRCATANHPSDRFCTRCGLPLGVAQPDAGAALDALGPYEAPEKDDSATVQFVRELAQGSGFESAPFGHGWRVLVPLHLDRRQAVFLAPAGTAPDGRPVAELVSVCGPANERDARTLLKLNARPVPGRFAIKVLLGEEYFVVVHALEPGASPPEDAAGLILAIAAEADGLEERLTRGRDLY
jgi:hypothetical protein